MQKPSKEDLELYYVNWLEGYSNEDIFHALRRKGAQRYTSSKFKRFLPFFTTYCQDKNKQQFKASGPDSIPFNDFLADQYLEHIAHGLSPAEASELINTPLATIFDSWMKNNKDFAIRAKYAFKMKNIEVQRALFKRSIGYSYDSEEYRSGVRDGKLGPVPFQETTRKTIHVPASVNANKFWLTNRDPDNWSLDGTHPHKNNKGKILEALDKLTEISEEDLKEQDAE